jgi:IS30 family transposase
MGYQRLTLQERYQISALKKSGKGIRAIARELKRDPSSISREIKNNSGWYGYDAGLAQSKSKQEKDKKSRPAHIVQGRLGAKIIEKLKLDWSPEQISGWLKREGVKTPPSYSTIYRFIYRDARLGGSLYQHLRRCRRKRKKRVSTAIFRGVKNTRSIKQRPKAVNKKERLGDLERDTVRGTRAGAVILTINDRVSRKVSLGLSKTKCSRKIHTETLRILKNRKVHTITNDNGTEFAKHAQTEKRLRAKIYFSRPGCAWERGANENTNGLLRQYFPREMDFNSITLKQLKEAEKKLNNRPRKCLGYKTPNQVEREKGQVLR